LREWHRLATQKPVSWQSESAEQLVLQAFAPHTYALQLVCCDAGQRPAPSQVVAAEATPFEQLAARHWLSAGG